MPGKHFLSMLLSPAWSHLVRAAWVVNLIEERAWWALGHKELSCNWKKCGGRSCRAAETGKWQGGSSTCPGLSYILHCLLLCICLKRSTFLPTHVHYLLKFLNQSSKLTCSWKLSPTSPTWQITYLLLLLNLYELSFYSLILCLWLHGFSLVYCFPN